mmetsp:Transcript_30991/g.94852  ORF Transcript_30991/g.94852 Transcript_30991/m.94852 type:complete len:88 (-) Transcript_30991:141-404(-)
MRGHIACVLQFVSSIQMDLAPELKLMMRDLMTIIRCLTRRASRHSPQDLRHPWISNLAICCVCPFLVSAFNYAFSMCPLKSSSQHST